MPGSALYSDLSRYYDLMCSNIDYGEQCSFSHRIYNLLAEVPADNHAVKVLDLACGTGPHVEQFNRLGYNAAGLDVNARMLEQAKLRCPNAEFSLQDMCDFTFSQSFALVTCFLYSMHYCYPQARFYQAIQCAYASLCSGGLLIFDMVGRQFIANDSGYTHSLSHTDGEFAFQSRWFDAKTDDKLDLFITISKNSGGLCESWQDTHTMLAIEVHIAVLQLEAIGFEVFVFNRDFSKISHWQGDEGNVILVGKKTA